MLTSVANYYIIIMSQKTKIILEKVGGRKVYKKNKM